MSRRSREIETPGTDSFLDVVANLVGILIILVVVIGASAASSWSEPKQTDQQRVELDEIETQVEIAAKEANNYEHNNRELKTKIDNEKVLISAKQQMRHQMLMQLEWMNQKVDSEKSQLDQQRQSELARDATRRLLEDDLRKINSQIESIGNTQKKIEKIEHFPTPVAQTVFNQEYHFELKNGRVTVVPIDELVELVKRELQVKAEKLHSNNSSSTIETVGPVGNFRMQYLLSASNTSIATSSGLVKQRTIQFKQFILLPIRKDSGTLHKRAIEKGGELHDLVSRLDPQKTTISIWVYPDSYAEFREIKAWLYARGFQTAVWPLPQNAPISGGPNGFKSASQ